MNEKNADLSRMLFYLIVFYIHPFIFCFTFLRYLYLLFYLF